MRGPGSSGNRLAVTGKPLRRPLRRLPKLALSRVAMEEGHGAKHPPCANKGCNAPGNSSGQQNFLPAAEKLIDLDLLYEDATCSAPVSATSVLATAGTTS